MWHETSEGGVPVLEHDGYTIETGELLKAPGFWVGHVSDKIWGTPQVLADLVDWVVMETQNRTVEAVIPRDAEARSESRS